MHENVIQSRAVPHELAAGRTSHYLLGGGLALSYPALYLVSGVAFPESHVGPALLWGLGTVLLPWMVLYPAFGWGFFGVRAPGGTRPLLSPTIAHLLYGLAVGSVVTIAT